MKQDIIKTIKSKYFFIPVFLVSFILTGLIAYFSSINDEIIFPNLEVYNCEYYTDKANEGNSTVLEHTISESLIKTVFLLRDDFLSPYVGLSFSAIVNEFLDAKKYNQIELEISGQNIDRIGLSIYTPSIISTDIPNEEETLFHSYLNISDERKVYEISIMQLQPPEWWEDVHHMSENEEYNPDLSKILHINISSAFSPSIDNEKKLEIYALAFTRNNDKLFSVFGFMYVCFILLIFLIFYFTTKRGNTNSNITLTYKALEIDNDKTSVEKCIQYINSNYNNSNLSLDIISKEAGISPRKITAIIHETYNCNFKTYLNNIRINESKRFLTQSELNIGEIAYKVGFNSQSHFNRVFKNEIRINPSEYRENIKA